MSLTLHEPIPGDIMTRSRLHRSLASVLLDLLRRKKLVLLSPDKWEDRNDGEIISEYKKGKKLAVYENW